MGATNINVVHLSLHLFRGSRSFSSPESAVLLVSAKQKKRDSRDAHSTAYHGGGGAGGVRELGGGGRGGVVLIFK